MSTSTVRARTCMEAGVQYEYSYEYEYRYSYQAYRIPPARIRPGGNER